MGKYLGPNGLSYLWGKIKSHFAKSTYDATLNASGAADKAVSIPFAAVDSTSTSTAFTATVDGITELRDGVCCYIKNGVVTSAAGCTLDINGLGAKPIYQTMAATTAVTTTFNINYTMLFVYNSTRVSGGCWDMFYGYNSNDDVNAYNVRENYVGSKKVKTANGRYMLFFTCADGMLLPVNTDNNVTDATHVLTTESFNPFGEIYYFGSTNIYSAGGIVGNTLLYSQYTNGSIDLRYSFNTTNTLVAGNDVYLVCVPQPDGQVKLAENPISFNIPLEEDGLLYKRLGKCYSTTNIILEQHKPIYYYKDGAIRQWTNPEQNITEGVYVEDEWNKKNSTRTGDTEIKKVDGKTMVWNQIITNPDFSDGTNGWRATGTGATISVSDGVISAYSSTGASYFGTTTNTTNAIAKNGHKYYVSIMAKCSVAGLNLGYPYIDGDTFTNTAPTSVTTIGSEWVKISKILTAKADGAALMGIRYLSSTAYGSPVTIYCKNPKIIDLTAMFGTGNEPTSVEEFEKLFPLDSYSYDAGRIINVAPTAIKSTDAGGSDLDQVALPITTLTGKPTGSSTSEIIFPNGMNGIGDVKDEIDFETGKAIKRIGSVLFTDLGWSYGLANNYYRFSASVTGKAPGRLNILCKRYYNNSAVPGVTDADMCISGYDGTSDMVYIHDFSCDGVPAFRTAVAGEYLYYELATPIEYTLDTITLDKYKAETGGTETILPYGGAAPTIAPVKIGLEYKASYQEKLVSGTNIKTINNESILGSGNITIQGGGGSGEENVIEIVKVNNTALTPDANKAVNIDLTDYDKKPLVIEVNDTDTTVPSGTYASITAALAEGRDVIAKVAWSDDDQTLYLNLVEDYYVDNHYTFGGGYGQTSFLLYLYTNDTLEFEYYSLAESTHTHGNINTWGGIDSDIAIANGDKLVITDSSTYNHISRASLTFDGSTTSKALTQKGTWETFSTTSPGTLNTTATTAQSTSASEALSGSVTLHKVAKTGTYSDLISKPTPTTSTDEALARYDSTGGNLQDSLVTLDDDGNMFLPVATSTTFSSNAKLCVGNAWFGSNPSGGLCYGVKSGTTFTAKFVFESSGLRPVSSADGAVDLGTSSYRWRDIYITGAFKDGTYTLSLPSKSGTIATTDDVGGVTIYTGTSTPSSSLGSDGDIYVKTSS